MKIPVMQDKNGNELIYFNGLWWSRNFDRFWQLLTRRDAPPVMICRLYPGMNPKFLDARGKIRRLYWWDKWCRYGWAFFDPETQQLYPCEREINETMENCYEKKSVSKS
jgi:hypothetical protein